MKKMFFGLVLFCLVSSSAQPFQAVKAWLGSLLTSNSNSEGNLPTIPRRSVRMDPSPEESGVEEVEESDVEEVEESDVEEVIDRCLKSIYLVDAINTYLLDTREDDVFSSEQDDDIKAIFLELMELAETVPVSFSDITFKSGLKVQPRSFFSLAVALKSVASIRYFAENEIVPSDDDRRFMMSVYVRDIARANRWPGEKSARVIAFYDMVLGRFFAPDEFPTKENIGMGDTDSLREKFLRLTREEIAPYGIFTRANWKLVGSGLSEEMSDEEVVSRLVMTALNEDLALHSVACDYNFPLMIKFLYDYGIDFAEISIEGAPDANRFFKGPKLVFEEPKNLFEEVISEHEITGDGTVYGSIVGFTGLEEGIEFLLKRKEGEVNAKRVCSIERKIRLLRAIKASLEASQEEAEEEEGEG